MAGSMCRKLLHPGVFVVTGAVATISVNAPSEQKTETDSEFRSAEVLSVIQRLLEICHQIIAP